MNWQDRVVRRTLELAGDDTHVVLQFLLDRLEHVPGGLDAIIAAMRDAARWSEDQANALRAEKARRQAQARLSEIVKAQK